MILYRADSRFPGEIRESGGFFAKSPMSPKQAREHLLSYCGLGSPLRYPNDLSREIIASPKPLYISTDPSADCGGYAHKGYVFRIEMPELSERPFSAEVLGFQVPFTPNKFYPKLLLNADTLAEASCIALQHYGMVTREVTFLTAIPFCFVTGYRLAEASDFVST